MDFYNPSSDLSYHGDVVVFDLDDTLYPEEDYVFSGFRAVAESVAAGEAEKGAAGESSAKSDAETFRIMKDAYLSGKNAFDALARELGLAGTGAKAGTGAETGAEAEKNIAAWVDIYRTHLPEISLPADSLHTLQELQRRGVKLGIATDGRSLGQRLKIRALGLDALFQPENIYISGEHGHDKHDFEPFAWFVHRYPEARRFIYAGDNPDKDFLNPNLMGWTTVCVADRGRNIHPQRPQTPEEKNPQFTIDSLSDLLTKIL